MATVIKLNSENPNVKKIAGVKSYALPEPNMNSPWAIPEGEKPPIPCRNKAARLLEVYDKLMPAEQYIVDLANTLSKLPGYGWFEDYFYSKSYRTWKRAPLYTYPLKRTFNEVVRTLQTSGLVHSYNDYMIPDLVLPLLFRKYQNGTYFRDTEMGRDNNRSTPIRPFDEEDSGSFYLYYEDLFRQAAFDAMVTGKAKTFHKIWRTILASDSYPTDRISKIERFEIFLQDIFAPAVRDNLYNRLDPEIQKTFVEIYLDYAILTNIPLPEYFFKSLLEYSKMGFVKKNPDPLASRFLIYLAFSGHFEEIEHLRRMSIKFGPTLAKNLEGVKHFLSGNLKEAKDCFDTAKPQVFSSKVKALLFDPVYEMMSTLCSYALGDPDFKRIALYKDKKATQFQMGSWTLLKHIADTMKTGIKNVDTFYVTVKEYSMGVPWALSTLIKCSALLWYGCKQRSSITSAIDVLKEIIKEESVAFPWLVEQAKNVLENLKEYEKDFSNFTPNGFFPQLVKFTDRWDIVKKALSSINDTPSSEGKSDITEQTERLTWRFSSLGREPHQWVLEPYLQTITTTGKWSAGKKVAMARLYKECNSLSYLTEQDKKICKKIDENIDYSWGAKYYYTFSNSVLLELVGHPLIVDRSNPTHSIQMRQTTPILEIVDKDGQSYVRISPFPDTKKSLADYMVFKSAPDVYDVMVFNKKHLAIAKLLTENGLAIPKGREKEINELIEPMMKDFKVNAKSKASEYLSQSDLVENVDPDSRIHVLLEPDQDQLSVQLSVYPIGVDQSPAKPAGGMETLFWQKDNVSACTHRSFSDEKKNLQLIKNACPILNQADKDGDKLVFSTADDSFEFLSELESLLKEYRVEASKPVTEEKPKKRGRKPKKEAVAEPAPAPDIPATPSDQPQEELLAPDAPLVVRWPKGNRRHTSSVATFKNLKMSLNSVGNWFEASGSIEVDDEQVELSQLLLAMEKTKSRFVEIRPGEYLSLSEQFRKRMDEFKLYARQQGNGLKIHPLAAQAIDSAFTPIATELGGLQTPPEWKAALERFRAADHSTAKLPKTFQGSLREYQLEGFQWLMQLATWGAGGCLADDMGLGKTIQSIAVLLARAKLGPALVVAPTSVCSNWERELERFAPSLNTIRVASYVETGGKIDRGELIQSAKSNDVVITNYSILSRESEAFAQKEFATVLLDEAQAIKNHLADRTQAVMQLKSDFRFITTGTPIENNLGELWSLFEFINPGFLGTRPEFDRKFAGPIERDNSKETKTLLKRMIRPFILRRFKSDVLTELPQKTEIQYDVVLSTEEMSIYEAIRRNAVKTLNSMKNDKAGEKRIQILAELMKLRRVCCHPSLALPDTDAPCSKLDTLVTTINDLLAGNHKVLVFSQFVDYLKLIAARFEKEKIGFQYLDGSMSQKKRQEAIDAFQTGDDGVFLISLKAGGFGLNLTAADYVIHTDPWWNPAVENQASDRAHRIGQTRPVTIYRMIAKGTIEEKIIELHKRKEALAQEILADSDAPTKVSLEDLLGLLGQ